MSFNLNEVDLKSTIKVKKAYPLIEDKTCVPVSLHIIRGGYNDVEKDWTNGYATLNPKTGVIYLNCYVVILSGPYEDQRIYFKIGLHSPKNETYCQMGLKLVRKIFDSAYALSQFDNSLEATKLREEIYFHDLDYLKFIACLGIEKGQHGYPDRNFLRDAVTPDDPRYIKMSKH